MVPRTQSGASVGKRLRRRLGRNPRLVGWYNLLKFIFLRYPRRDLRDWKRTKLFLTVKPYTMISYPRMAKLHEIASLLERERIEGSFVECGVWNGGSAGIMAWAGRDNPGRHVWLFDSWEGLPEPDASDIHCSGRPGKKGECAGTERNVRKLLFRRLHLDERRVHLVKGWFQDTLPGSRSAVGPIALLHIDADWYESVKLCLTEFYPSLVEGGYVVFDDYGEWRGCQKAVDEFFRERGVTVSLEKIDFAAVCFRKTRQH